MHCIAKTIADMFRPAVLLPPLPPLRFVSHSSSSVALRDEVPPARQFECRQRQRGGRRLMKRVRVRVRVRVHVVPRTNEVRR